MPIDFTPDINRIIRNEVKRANAKIQREINKNPMLAQFYPDKLSSKGVKEDISSLRDLRVFRNSVDRLFRKNAFNIITNQNNVAITRYEYNELKLGVQRINRARAREFKRLNPRPETGTMGLETINAYKPKKFDFKNMTPRGFAMFEESVRNQARSSYFDEKMIAYKENYIQAILNNYDSNDPRVRELLAEVQRISPSKLYDVYYDDPILQIGFVYPDSLQEETILTTVLAHLRTL